MLQHEMRQTEEEIQLLTEHIRLYPMVENKIELKKIWLVIQNESNGLDRKLRMNLIN